MAMYSMNVRVMDGVQASEVMAESRKELIETEECVKACGVERMTVGICAESLAEGGFTEKLCSPRRYNNCPNIIDLYFNLAAGKGAGIVCEKLPAEICAFSVSSSGARCLLHKSCILRDGDVQYECQASEVMAESMKESIETEECVKACGVERMTMGMSAESLAEGGFTEKLCSPGCYNNCSNIIDLYFNLAAGKGKLGAPAGII